MDIDQIREELLDKAKKIEDLDLRIGTEDLTDMLNFKMDYSNQVYKRKGRPMFPMRLDLNTLAEWMWLEWITLEAWDAFLVVERWPSRTKCLSFTRVTPERMAQMREQKGRITYWFVRKGLTADEIRKLYENTLEVTM